MPSPADIRARVLAAADTPERRRIHDLHFAPGAPRKLTSAARYLPLATARGLDLGCGHGVHLVHFGPGSVGLDADPARVEFARSIGLAAEVRDLDEAGWSDGLEGFDFAFAADLLMHLRRPHVLFAELAGVLRPGGSLVLSEWLWPERGALARALARRVPGAATVWDHPEHLRRYTERGLLAEVEAAGLRVARCWVHSFRSAWLGRAVRGFWPPRTVVAERPL